MPDVLQTGSGFAVHPLGPAVGAVVEGLDLSRPLSDAEQTAVEKALSDHHVLFFENQPLTPRQQRDFTARFGALHIHPVYPSVPEQPEIMVLDTGPHNPTDNDVWHTDVTFIETPPAVVALAAKKTPPIGGDTLWSSCEAAYQGLSEPLRRLLDPLTAEHDFTRAFPYRTHAGPDALPRWREARDRHLPLTHPVIRRHPVTGRKGIFVSENFTTRILELNPRESDGVLRIVFDHVARPEYTVRRRWKPNDLALWDNRSTQHYAVNDYLPHSRLMHRATVIGDKPFGP